MSEPEIVVAHREQLAELLTEAVEVEHNLMCCYLYAAWSLKTGPGEGLTADQTREVQSWRRTILNVAIDEMAHFANANNVLASIGARPHVGRPNFPVAPGYHPAEVLVALHPFSQSTIDHFVYLERPQGTDLPDGEAFQRERQYVRATTAGAMMPSAQDFDTVGQLYRGIQDGLRQLADALGEQNLFVGEPEHQIRFEDVSLDGLMAVRDLETALQAVENIVIQGEGNLEDPEHSHYRKFCGVRDAYQKFLREDPSFEPTRLVARNPVQRRPPIPENKTWIGASDAGRLLDFVNALYNHMLRTVGAAYEPLPSDTRSVLVSEAIGLMMALGPLNDVLTRLPASREMPSISAGMSFAVTREIRVPPASVVVPVLSERTRQLASAARQLADLGPAVAELGEQLESMADRIDALP
ncbi:MAG: ferritin-like protein [Myxococcota bacterium]